LISDGPARNAVPETVKISVEIRSHNVKKLIRHTEHFTKAVDNVLSKYPDSTIDIHIFRQFDAYRFKDKHPVVERIRNVLSCMKIKPVWRESMGGSDVNIFHTHGIEAINIGIAVYNAHTTREFVNIPEFVESTEFLSRFLLA
jgi:di/tripeptidase